MHTLQFTYCWTSAAASNCLERSAAAFYWYCYWPVATSDDRYVSTRGRHFL